MNEVSTKDSGGGNTVCHLNTDGSSVSCESSGGPAASRASEAAESSSKAIEAGR